MVVPVVVLVGGCCLCVWWVQDFWALPLDRPKFRSFFFSLPPEISFSFFPLLGVLSSFFSLSLGGLLVEFGGVFEASGP